MPYLRSIIATKEKAADFIAARVTRVLFLSNTLCLEPKFDCRKCGKSFKRSEEDSKAGRPEVAASMFCGCAPRRAFGDRLLDDDGTTSSSLLIEVCVVS